MKTIALIGHPNVGKSTLFNKIVGHRTSIIEDIPGVTRDRIYEEVTYENKRFNLIDTGGITNEKGNFNQDIKMQASIAINESDLIVFIVDGEVGLTDEDRTIASLLKKSKKDVIVAINKMDTKLAKENIYDFYQLGFSDYFEVSAIHNTGYVELLDKMTEDINPNEEEVLDERLHISIIGRPNVGKSSLMNALLNEDRVVVSDIAGTTRDSINSVVKYHGEEIVFVDTAGIRKRGKIEQGIEKYSLYRSMYSIDKSDITLLVIDADDGIKENDKHIAGYAIEKGKGLIIVVNKWDLVEDYTIDEYTKIIRDEFQFCPYAEIVFLSALTKKRISTLIPKIKKVEENINREVKTSYLNSILEDAMTKHIPPSYKGKRLKVYFANQTGTKPPKFTLHCNSKELVHFSYYRYLENQIRDKIDFTGTPIVLQFKNRSGDE